MAELKLVIRGPAAASKMSGLQVRLTVLGNVNGEISFTLKVLLLYIFICYYYYYYYFNFFILCIFVFLFLFYFYIYILIFEVMRFLLFPSRFLA